MVSKIRYEAMPTFSFKKNSDVVKIILIIVMLPLFAIYPSKVIFPGMMLFIVSGLVRTIIDHFKHSDDDDEVSDIPAVE